MKHTKYMFIDAQLYDYAYMEEKLTRLASEGWHLEKAGNLLWKFRRGEPKQVRYAIAFAPTASAYNSRPTEEEEELADLCAQAGWVRVATQAQRHIYRNENPDATPLETDEGERLKNIRNTMYRHFFLTEALMILVFLMQSFTQWRTFSMSPVRSFSSYMMVSTLFMSLFVAVTHGILALDAALWLRRARIAVEDGEDIPENRFYRKFRWVIWAFLIGYSLCLLWTVGLAFFVWVVLTCAVMLLTITGATALCKRLNAPKWVNIVVPSGLCFLVIAVLAPLLVFSFDTGEPSPAEELPVTLTQLTGETSTERTIMEENCTFLSSYGRYWDTGKNDVRITYTIVDVKCPWLYDMLLDEQEADFLMGAGHIAGPLTEQQAQLFDAEYARHASNGLGDRYLICWDSRIIHLRTSWELTEQQIAMIAEQLKP